MKKLTPRQLASGSAHGRMGRRIAEKSLQQMKEQGWLPNRVPRHRRDYDERLVFIRANHPFAAIFRSVAVTGEAILSRLMVEQAVQCPLVEPRAGAVLARHGLLIRAVDDNAVTLTAVDPELARIVNASRYRTSRGGHDASVVIRAALRRLDRPQRLRENARLEAAEVLEGFGVDAGELLDGGRRVHLRSPWTLHDGDANSHQPQM